MTLIAKLIATMTMVAIPEVGSADHCGHGTRVFDRIGSAILRVEAFNESNVFQPPGLGSGVRIDEELAVTAHHVVAGALKISVVHADGHRQPAQVVAEDPHNDVALLHLAERQVATPVRLSRGDDLRPGRCVAALGDVMRAGVGIFCGMISMATPGAILTDITAPPGMSGGALVDCETGELLGVVTFGLLDLTSPRSTSGLLGAVPVSLVRTRIVLGRHPLVGATAPD